MTSVLFECDGSFTVDEADLILPKSVLGQPQKIPTPHTLLKNKVQKLRRIQNKDIKDRGEGMSVSSFSFELSEEVDFQGLSKCQLVVSFGHSKFKYDAYGGRGGGGVWCFLFFGQHVESMVVTFFDRAKHELIKSQVKVIHC